MDKIFKYISNVFAWLGPLDEDGVALSGTFDGAKWDLIDYLEYLGSHFWEYTDSSQKLSELFLDLSLIFQRYLSVV
jgi:hypothetical protein